MVVIILWVGMMNKWTKRECKDDENLGHKVGCAEEKANIMVMVMSLDNLNVS